MNHPLLRKSLLFLVLAGIGVFLYFQRQQSERKTLEIQKLQRPVDFNQVESATTTTDRGQTQEVQ